MSQLSFFVPGIPSTAGSKRFVGTSKAGRGIIVDSSGAKGKAWRAVVAFGGQEAAKDLPRPHSAALALTCNFHMPRRKGDLKKDGTPKPSAPIWHTTKPDATKMFRAVEDALTSILWTDDAIIACQHATKVYSDRPGVQITISKLDP
jgi:Holliday junction resolvase RusA-like endonuclease